MYQQAYLRSGGQDIRLNYLESWPKAVPKATILLIHGWPQSSYQYRHVIDPLAQAGYHVIAPDYRGHGYSSRPLGATDWTKRQLAQDLYQLVRDALNIKEKIHIVGHDIGGMIAHAYVAQFPQHVASIVWGECPLPGTAYYEQVKHSAAHWHFDFHSHDPDMAAALIAGREKMYIEHFFDKQAQNHAGLPADAVEFYAQMYAMPQAMRCAFLTYQAFEQDAADNRRWLQQKGKVAIRSLVLSGESSWAAQVSGEMAREMYADVQEAIVESSGHYLAEENPVGFVEKVLQFVDGSASGMADE